MLELPSMSNETPHEEILILAKKLIKIPTTADNIAGLNQAVVLSEQLMKGYTINKFSTDGKPSLLIHNAKPKTKQFTILLNAHLDVVQAEDSAFKPIQKDGKLYGRGAYDMKSAAAVIILLYQELARKLEYPIALQLTTDEEKGSYGAKKHVDEGYRATFILTGECGSNFRITNQAKGVYHARLTATGTASHGAYAWKGDNAIMKLVAAITRIAAKYPNPTGETWETTVNITRLKTFNEATNRIPDEAQAHLDIRYNPENSTILSEIISLLPADVTLHVEAHYPPLNTKPNNPYLQLLHHASDSVLKREVGLRNAHATSDIVHFAEVGCAGVEFGPVGGNQHSDNEWVAIQSLSDYYQILKQFLLSIK